MDVPTTRAKPMTRKQVIGNDDPVKKKKKIKKHKTNKVNVTMFY